MKPLKKMIKNKFKLKFFKLRDNLSKSIKINSKKIIK